MKTPNQTNRLGPDHLLSFAIKQTIYPMKISCFIYQAWLLYCFIIRGGQIIGSGSFMKGFSSSIPGPVGKFQFDFLYLFIWNCNNYDQGTIDSQNKI